MTQEFHISVTPIGSDQYLVRTERVAPGVPLAEEQVIWPVDTWLAQTRQLMNDPLLGLLQGDGVNRIGGFELPDNMRSRQTPEGSAEPAISLVELGQQLYSGLFQGTLRDSWMTARGISHHRGEVLRLRLGLKGLRLPRLPWEVLHGDDFATERVHQRGGGVSAPRPIATGTDVVFSRYQLSTGLVSAHSQPALDADQPLRILMVIAAPTDQERLELKREVNHLQQELRYQSGSLPESLAETLPDIQVTVLDQPGREQLTQALEQGQYQVLHYAGHSNLGASGGNLYLVNSKTGLTEILNGDDLAGLLANNGIRMAVFNSCRGAHTAAADSAIEEERNLAEALVSRGIPAVLAMAEQIPDDVALTLTRLFYRNLKQGYPIDLSLSRARQGLISAYGSNQLYWALPILYLHPEFDGYLTTGDRSVDNPADRLLLRPQVYEAIPTLTGEESDVAVNGMAAQSSEGIDDWAMLSDAVLADDDLSDLVEDLEYEDDFGPEFEGGDDEDLNYEEDISVVSSLIQQLSHLTPPPDEVLPASNSENLLPDSSASGLEIYHQLPENPLYRQSGGQSQVHIPAGAFQAASADSSATAQPATAADGSLAAAPSGEPAQPHWQMNSSGTAALHQPSSIWQQLRSRSMLVSLMIAFGAVAIAFTGFSVVFRLASSEPSPADLLSRFEPYEPSLEDSLVSPNLVNNDLSSVDTDAVTSLAISLFSKNQLADGSQAVSALLDRGALPQARAALTSVEADKLDNPDISFLLGRLAWQSVQAGDTDYSVDDARRYWETATRDQSASPLYYNALGFAYYSEGNYKDAIQAWTNTLSLLEDQEVLQDGVDEIASANDVTVPSQLVINDQALTAYAGITLALKQASADPNFGDAANLLSKSEKLYQMVVENDPVGFQPQELAKNWLWSEPLIQEWQNLGM